MAPQVFLVLSAPPDCPVFKGSEASQACLETRENRVLQDNLATQVPWAPQACLVSRENEDTPVPRERRGSRAHQVLKAFQVPKVQRVPEESEAPRGALERRVIRDFKASRASQAHRVLQDSQAKLELLAHLAPRQRRAVKGSAVPQACLAPLGHQALLGFRAPLGWTDWTGRTASLA